MSSPLRTVLVSYRRADVPHLARRVYDALLARFPERVFFDIEEIEPGQDFVEAIDAALASAGALVAVIGDDWTARQSAGRSRLLDEHDFVRLELAAALRAGVRVFPVLAPGAEPPPAADLPDELQRFARLQALSLTDAHLHEDLERLVELVARALGEERPRVALIGMPGNDEWTVTIQVLDQDVREILWRVVESGDTSVGGRGPLRSSGFELARNARTGLPLPRAHIELASGDAPRTLEIAYVDARGVRQGPFALHFDPRTELVRFVKHVLGLTNWVEFGRDVEGRSVAYFTALLSYKAALRAVRYSFNDETTEHALRIVPARRLSLSELDEGDESFVALPAGARRVRVRLEFVDGSEQSADFTCQD